MKKSRLKRIKIKWKFGKEEKKVIAEKLFDLANIGAGVLLFGQFISDKRLPTSWAIISVVVVIVLYILSLWILKGGKQ